MTNFTQNLQQIAQFNIFFKRDDKILLVKNFFIFIFNILVFIAIILTGYFGYNNQRYIINDLDNNMELINPNEWGNLNLIPDNIRVLRGLMDMFIAIYIFMALVCWKYGYNFFKKDRTLAIIYILNFIPFFSLFGFVYNFKYFTKARWNSEFWYMFSTKKELKEEYKWGTWKRSLVLIEWLIFLPTLLFVFYSENDDNVFNVTWTNKFFFNSLFYFTIESNMITFMFLTLLLFFPSWIVFKNNFFQICVSSYIALVGLVWLFILLPNFVINNNVKFWSSYYLVSTLWLHIVNPFSFIAFSLILITRCKKNNNDVRTQSLLNILFFPIVYTTFITILPFNTGVSVYGWVTNLNPNLGIFTNLHELNSTIYFGKWYYVFVFVAVNIICFVIAYFFAYLEHRFKLKHNVLISEFKE